MPSFIVAPMLCFDLYVYCRFLFLSLGCCFSCRCSLVCLAKQPCPRGRPWMGRDFNHGVYVMLYAFVFVCSTVFHGVFYSVASVLLPRQLVLIIQKHWVFSLSLPGQVRRVFVEYISLERNSFFFSLLIIHPCDFTRWETQLILYYCVYSNGDQN